MDIEEALTAYILAQPGITALIDRRFYFDEAPEGDKLPYIVCTNISDVKIHSHDGQNRAERPVYQFGAYAATRAGARALAEKIKSALSDYGGEMGGIRVHWIRLLNEFASQYKASEGLGNTNIVDLEYEVNFYR